MEFGAPFVLPYMALLQPPMRERIPYGEAQAHCSDCVIKHKLRLRFPSEHYDQSSSATVGSAFSAAA